MKVYEGETNYIISDSGETIIAEMIEGGIMLAHQFAAAPDLLAALKIILEYPYGDASPLDDPLVMERARSAIRKADGEGE